MNMRKSLFLLALCALCGWNVAHAQWSVTPKAGVNVTKESGSPAKIGYKVGAAVRYEFENSGFSLQSGLYFTQRGRGVNRSLNLWGEGIDQAGNKVEFSRPFILDGEDYCFSTYYYSSVYNDGYYYSGLGVTMQVPDLKDAELKGMKYYESHSRRYYLQLPIMARYDWKIGDKARFHLALGPYIAYGLGGNAYSEVHGFELKKNEGRYEIVRDYQESESNRNPFHQGVRRFDWGISAEAGFDIGRWSIGLDYDLGLGKQYRSDGIDAKYHTISLTVGYRF